MLYLPGAKESWAFKIELVMPPTSTSKFCWMKPRLVMLKVKYCMKPAGTEWVWVADRSTFFSVYTPGNVRSRFSRTFIWQKTKLPNTFVCWTWLLSPWQAGWSLQCHRRQRRPCRLSSDPQWWKPGRRFECGCLQVFVLNCGDAGFKLRVTMVTGSMTGARNCPIDLKLITHHLRSFGFYQHSPSCQSRIGVLGMKMMMTDESWQWPTADHGKGHAGKHQLTSAAGPVTSALPTPTLYIVIFCQWWQRSWWLTLMMIMMTLILMTCI